MFEATSAKVLSPREACAQRERWRQEGRVVVFTNGCYDLLHPGHLEFLTAARALGDVLLVAINSDASVRRNKGPERPIVPDSERAEVLAALRSVDAVTMFDEDTPARIVAALVPDILVKGQDWSHLVVGRETVEAAGGRVVLLPLREGYSTTSLVERARAANSAANGTGTGA